MMPDVAILCGGRGKRLIPLTNELPKPLIQLLNKPILEHVLNFFMKKGFKRFILCVGYKGGKIKKFVEEYNSNNGGDFRVSDLGEDASILQRIYALKNTFEERIFCTYGDTLTDLNIDELTENHIQKGALMTVTASKIKSPFGFIDIDENGWATSFIEKPVFNYYIGHFIMEKEAMKYISPEMLNEPDGKGLISFFLRLIGSKSLNVYLHQGAQITFNTEIEKMNAEKEIIDFYSQREE